MPLLEMLLWSRSTDCKWCHPGSKVETYSQRLCTTDNETNRDRCDAVRDPFNLAEERLLFHFASDADLQRWTKFQDKDLGGQSTVALEPSMDNPVRVLTLFLLKASYSVSL